MQRAIAFSTAAVLVALYAACAKPPPFHQMRTPSGDFCSDMPIFAGRDQPEREFHRLGPVKTAASYRTVVERLEALRKEACAAQADAVIEAHEDEVRLPDGAFGKMASGTAIIWTRRPDSELKPLGIGSVSGKKPEGEFKEVEPEPVSTAKEPPPLNTSVEVKSPPPEPKPTATAAAPTPEPTATAAPTTTTKTTTKTKTKTK